MRTDIPEKMNPYFQNLSLLQLHQKSLEGISLKERLFFLKVLSISSLPELYDSCLSSLLNHCFILFLAVEVFTMPSQSLLGPFGVFETIISTIFPFSSVLSSGTILPSTLASNTVMSNICMNLICKIYWCCPSRKVYYFAFWSKNKNLFLKQDPFSKIPGNPADP